MSNVLINEQHLTDIANAIRAKNGSTDTYTPGEMAAAIKSSETDLTIEDFLQDENNTLTEYTSSDVTRMLGCGAFRNFTALQSVSLPNATAIGNYGFEYCKSLKNVYLPKVNVLNINSFFDCNSLEFLDLPKVYEIRSWALSCSRLKTVILRNTSVSPTIAKDAFWYSSLDGEYAPQGYIYVPAVLYDTYYSIFGDCNNGSALQAALRKIEDYPEICGEVS